MSKINFTEEHANRLGELVLAAVFAGVGIPTYSVGTPTISVYDAIHTTTLKSLLHIRQGLDKEIAAKADGDEWSITDREQRILNELRKKRELINLLIGFRRSAEEKEALQNKKAGLCAKLDALKESTKTPEDKIKELETQIAELGDL